MSEAVPEPVDTRDTVPPPWRVLRWTSLGLYLPIPLVLIASLLVDDPTFGIFAGIGLIIYVLPFTIMLSLIYLIVWLSTRHRYRYPRGWSTPLVVMCPVVTVILMTLFYLYLYTSGAFEMPAPLYP